jgi:hypothetical protein
MLGVRGLFLLVNVVDLASTAAGPDWDTKKAVQEHKAKKLAQKLDNLHSEAAAVSVLIPDGKKSPGRRGCMLTGYVGCGGARHNICCGGLQCNPIKGQDRNSCDPIEQEIVEAGVVEKEYATARPCDDGAAPGRWRMFANGTSVWLPKGCAYKPLGPEPMKQVAACLQKKGVSTLIFAGDSVMRRNWLWLTGAKKDTKLNYKGTYESETGGVTFQFHMLEGTTERQTARTINEILAALGNGTAAAKEKAVLAFNVGMWDLRAGVENRKYLEGVTRLASAIAEYQKEHPTQLTVIWKTTSSPQAQQALDQVGSSWGLSGSALNRTMLLSYMNGAADMLMKEKVRVVAAVVVVAVVAAATAERFTPKVVGWEGRRGCEGVALGEVVGAFPTTVLILSAYFPFDTFCSRCTLWASTCRLTRSYGMITSSLRILHTHVTTTRLTTYTAGE